eukprot:gene2143-5173_t
MEKRHKTILDLLTDEPERFKVLYIQAEKAAEDNRASERNAAVTIQRWWRGYKARKHIHGMENAAILIQRMVRGLHGRKYFRQMVKQDLASKQIQHYNAMATKIQALWKGYLQRKYGFNYYSRKAYLTALVLHNAEIKRELDAYACEQQARLEEAQKKEEQRRRLRELQKQHVLLSTRAQKGILLSSGHLPHEELTVRTIGRIQTRKVSARNLDKLSHTVPQIDQMSLPKKPQGPFKNPEDVAKIKAKEPRTTFRRQLPYTGSIDSCKSFERTGMIETKCSKGVLRSVLPFTTLPRTKPSVFASTPYIGEGPGDTRLKYGRSTFRSTEEDNDHIDKLAFTAPLGHISCFDEIDG